MKYLLHKVADLIGKGQGNTKLQTNTQIEKKYSNKYLIAKKYSLNMVIGLNKECK